MAEDVAGPFPLPGVTLETWLIRYNKDGKCVSPKTKEALLSRLTSQGHSPVILFSHGWNNEYEDASARYSNLLKHLQAHFAVYGEPKSLPVFVGILWPSTWFSTDKGPALAGSEQPKAAGDSFQSFKEELRNSLPEASRERFNTLTNSSRITSAEAQELASLTAMALRGGADLSQEGAELEAAGEEDVLAGMKALPNVVAGTESEGDDALPEGGVIATAPVAQAQAAGRFPDFLDPRNAIRVASVYTMKDRAGAVGFNGVSQLVGDILTSTPAPLHLVGHSYGAKVVLSAVAGAALPRNVETLLLLQPAVSYQCFATKVKGREGKGGYHAIPDRVKRHIATTFSRWDTSLHDLFHLALRRGSDLGEAGIAAANDAGAGDPPSNYSALGGYGPRGASEYLVKELPLPGNKIPELEKERMVGFDGTKDKRVSSHGDVSNPCTAWLLYVQLRG